MDLDGHLAEVIKLLSNAKLLLLGGVLTVSDRVEGLTWPWVVPVDGAAVDDTWELTAPVSELVSDWRKGENDMEVLSTDLHEEVVDLFTAVSHISLLGALAHFVADSELLVDGVQIGDLTSVEKVIDVFQEGLLDDLRVRE